jgi:hypothetical protein
MPAAWKPRGRPKKAKEGQPDLQVIRGGSEKPAPGVAPSVQHEVTLVTPGLAQKWLEGNTSNRTIVQKVAEKYAADMKAGKWNGCNGETIKFGLGEDGREMLYDGQHRLWAIIESGCSIWMEVISGLRPEDRPTIDVGLQRKTGDALVMFANNPYGRLDASIAQAVNLLCSRHTEKLSFAAVQDFCVKYAEGLEFIHTLDKTDRKLCKVPVLAAFVLAYPRAKEILPSFIYHYRLGTDLATGDPEHTLRDFILRSAASMTADRRGFMVKTLRAILARIRGEKLKRLEASEEAFNYFASAYKK